MRTVASDADVVVPIALALYVIVPDPLELDVKSILANTIFEPPVWNPAIATG
jgi:hypothetical protein